MTHWDAGVGPFYPESNVFGSIVCHHLKSESSTKHDISNRRIMINNILNVTLRTNLAHTEGNVNINWFAHHSWLKFYFLQRYKNMLSCYQNFFYKGKSWLQFKRPQDEPHTAQYLHQAEIMLSHSTLHYIRWLTWLF
jgi:hypothetical protein